MFPIPAAFAEREERKAERARARRERYEARVRGTAKDIAIRRAKHEANTGRIGHHAPDELKYCDYPFVMWDGEAPKDTGYSLFGSSLGHEICKPHLTTEECFDLLLEAKADNPQSIFFWFGGRYDWDEITRQSIPLQKLSRLKNSGSLWWHGYRLTEVEGKIYTISKGGVNVRIFETTGWFHCPYAKALRNYGVGCELCAHGRDLCPLETCCCDCQVCRIELGKGNRSEFEWSEIGDITKYMRLELALGPYLMDRIRGICLAADFNPRSWYGPSALAKQLITRNKIKNAMAECPEAVNLAAQFAFAGGRFEPFRGGIIDEPIIERDKNSAYMHAALELPNLARGTWRKGRDFEPGKFAVYHIKYHAGEEFEVSKPQPLFRRMENGTVCWPRSVEGWYWTPEAELVAGNVSAVFVEAWIFDEENNCDRPFAFVRKLYGKRLALQSLPDSDPTKEAEMAFKWALASVYGQLCRIVGWNKSTNRPPSTHQLEWAGYITSHCRADMYRLAIAVGGDLVSIDTDSVTSIYRNEASPVQEGRQLGEWKTTKAESGIFFQSGVYFLRQDGEWKKGKTRGMERRRGVPAVSPDILAEAIRGNNSVKLTPRRRYITTRMALNGQYPNHGMWREHPGNVLVFGGGGKRYHNSSMCRRYCVGSVHVFLPALSIPRDGRIRNTWSVPHYLPWKVSNETERLDVKLLQDILWVDSDNIDSDDQWIAEIIKRANATQSKIDGLV